MSFLCMWKVHKDKSKKKQTWRNKQKQFQEKFYTHRNTTKGKEQSMSSHLISAAAEVLCLLKEKCNMNTSNHEAMWEKKKLRIRDDK